MCPAVRIGIRIRAPREFVFQHLLTPHHLARWFCNFAQFDPKGPAIGTRFRFGGDYAIAAADPPGWECTILGGEVLTAVSFRWPLFGADTQVDWRVEESAEGSVLRVAHAGLPREESTCGRFHDAWRVCLGNLKAITEARDDSLRPDSSPIPDGPIRLNLLVGAPPSKVFAALTNPSLLVRWTEAADPAVDPRPGGVFSIGFPAKGVVAGIEPERRLSVAWSAAGHPTRGTFTLEEKGGGRTGLYLLLESAPADAALRVRCRWSDLLVGLKNLLETGETGFQEPYADQVAHA